MTGRVSVVIPARNACSTLGRCLEAVMSQTVAPFEVIVCDDCSTDSTASDASGAGAVVLLSDSRQGPSAARNRGAAAASGDVLLFLDADVVVPPDLLERIRAEFGGDPLLSAVQTVYSPVCPEGGLVTRYQNYYYHHCMARLGRRFVAVIATWCTAITKTAFDGLGGFDDSIPDPTVEDEELGYALADSGGRILLMPGLQVVHLASYDIRSFARRRFRMTRAQAKSAWRSVKGRLLARYANISDTGTHHSRWTVLGILLVMLATVALASAAVLAVAASPAAAPALAASLLCAAGAVLCCGGFLKGAARVFGAGVLPGFILLCLVDMAVLGAGLLTGTLEFLAGRRY